MIIKVPTSRITMGTKQDNTIVNLHEKNIIGRISLPKAKEMFPEFSVVNIDRSFVAYDVDEVALAQFLSEHHTGSRVNFN